MLDAACIVVSVRATDGDAEGSLAAAAASVLFFVFLLVAAFVGVSGVSASSCSPGTRSRACGHLAAGILMAGAFQFSSLLRSLAGELFFFLFALALAVGVAAAGASEARNRRVFATTSTRSELKRDHWLIMCSHPSLCQILIRVLLRWGRLAQCLGASCGVAPRGDERWKKVGLKCGLVFHGPIQAMKRPPQI